MDKADSNRKNVNDLQGRMTQLRPGSMRSHMVYWQRV